MDGMLSQDEINALLNAATTVEDEAPTTVDQASTNTILTDVERDAVGEVANICMGTSATTLYALVNRKVNITIPSVSVTDWQSLTLEYEKPCVFIQIKYTTGLDGSNMLVLKEQDVKVITDLMMGGDGTNTEDELGELHLSAISEAMNQMMGSSATSLSSMLGKVIDISPPIASLIPDVQDTKPEDIDGFLHGQFVRIEFRMQIDDDLVDSTLMQLYPIDFAKELVEAFMNNSQAAAPAPEVAPPMANPVPQQMEMPQMMQPQMMQPQMMQPQMMPQMGQPQMTQPQNVNIQTAQFQNFAQTGFAPMDIQNIELIRDVPLEVTVELGRTKKSIAEILEFVPGTIIELDKIAGEPIEVLVNGKFVAKGEVVVIEENFGIRVTEIIN
ncbi:MAG: flagellar motor switch phosphatase FliY [Eubacteriales bacterium]